MQFLRKRKPIDLGTRGPKWESRDNRQLEF